MSMHVTLCVALFILTMTASCPAQTIENLTDIQMTSVTEQSTAEISKEHVPATQVLLAEIVTWLSTHFELPAIHDYPTVKFVPAAKLASLRYNGSLTGSLARQQCPRPAAQSLSRSMSLPSTTIRQKRYTLLTPGPVQNTTEQSVLVHEMVHHLQNLGEMKYECPAAREKPAYIAQDEWLRRYGRDLEQEFEIDNFTVAVKSSCSF